MWQACYLCLNRKDILLENAQEERAFVENQLVCTYVSGEAKAILVADKSIHRDEQEVSSKHPRFSCLDPIKKKKKAADLAEDA